MSQSGYGDALHGAQRSINHILTRFAVIVVAPCLSSEPSIALMFAANAQPKIGYLLGVFAEGRDFNVEGDFYDSQCTAVDAHMRDRGVHHGAVRNS